jgi:imidazolonepropionase-like amidohydrolase
MSLLIRHARLHDGTGADPIDDATIVVEGMRIVAAGPAGAVAGVRGAQTIDAEGRALLPGLIDCHVHLCFDGSPDFEAFAAALTGERVRELCVQNVLRALEAGITTVRDLGGIGTATIDAARALRSGALRGARVLTAGEVLTTPGGHAHFIGREISSTEEMTKAVHELHDAGADLIKLIATGGVLTKGIGVQQSQFPSDQLGAGVAEAHALGMRVAAHAIGTEGIEAAARAGVDSIEHGCFLSSGSIERMIGNPSWLVGTLLAPDRISHGGPGVPDHARQKSAEVSESHRASFGAAVAAGVRIASGTDAGTPYNYIGMLASELRLMHEAGMPLHRLLPAATRSPTCPPTGAWPWSFRAGASS